ncbi:MAG: NUMOD3 domain-containing DNA-binding protein [Chloroflexota bacterium]|nr:NUMOD3 domain-containing DNA-binding protein [Chloroflexota bacterium]
MYSDEKCKRGRPSGYVMSEVSKRKISLKLKGRILSDDHRYKISIAMIGNTNRSKRNSPTLIDDLYIEYVSDYSEENIGAWIASVRDKLVLCSGIASNRRLSSYSFMELNVDNIDQFSGDFIDPESLLILSETIKEVLESD